MSRVLILAVLGLLLWRLVVGRWPWQPVSSVRTRAIGDARQLLGVRAAATQDEIYLAHRRIVAAVHPDRGGSNAQVHEANAARDLLLGTLSDKSKERA